ncbi:hypothetical protein STENM327S_06513 [Streptomyces tendae]
MTTHRIRVGIDVGGTFTDAVAVDATTLRLVGQVKVPTSHHHEDGVAHGIVEALDRLLKQTGHAPADVAFLAHGTTQATNALLEGDVATVGLLGIGTGGGTYFTRRLATLAKLELTPGKRLPLHYAHVPDPEDAPAVRAAVEQLTAAGAQALVASEPFGVDRPEGEEAVAEAARATGLPTTAAHEITSLYGLRKRTRTAVVNAAILPRMLATADLVDASITKAGVTAPLMVMRCDGGVMSLDEMRRRPLLTVLSGPAAGVAGALMQERVSEGVFLETGGTSTDISVVRRGKVAVRHAVLLGRASYLNALDVRTVGVGGGSMVRVSGGRVTGTGPRSAHIAGLPYACYADPADLRDAKLTTISPLPGDPADYAVLDAAGGRFALTMTCAANALGRVPEGDFAHADPDTAARAGPLAGSASSASPPPRRAQGDGRGHGAECLAIGVLVDCAAAPFVTPPWPPVDTVRGFMVKLFPFALVAAVAYVVIENRRRGTEHAWSLKSVSARPAPRRERLGDAPWYALLAPVVPLVLALGLDVAIIPSMLAGVLYALFTTTRPGEMNKRLLRTLYGGFEVAAAPLALFVAIGILLAAVKLPGAVDALEPLMKAVSPQNPVLFVIVFTVLVPLCLYRGPLNVFGLGAGIAGVLIATGIYPAVAVLGMATSYNQVFGVADPTSTQTVWAAQYAGVSPQQVMVRTLPYVWLVALGGMCVTAALYL